MRAAVLTTFRIYCNDVDAPGHNGADVPVKTLTLAPYPDGTFDWTTPVGGLRVDDERVLPSRADFMEQGTSPAARWRRTLACPACGDAVVVRVERLRPIVDRLLAHGVTALTLTGLRATLAHQ